MQVDASPFGVGAVLSHIMEDGCDKPVSYKSRTLSVAEGSKVMWRRKVHPLRLQ